MIKRRHIWQYMVIIGLQASQSVSQFINECVVITGQPRNHVYTQKIYQAYSDYCDRHELESVSKLKLIEWLKNNLPSCNHRRLHDTGKNPLSGFDGMFLKKEYDGLKGE